MNCQNPNRNNATCLVFYNKRQSYWWAVGEELKCSVTWEVVDIASVQQKVAVGGITEGRHEAGQRHGCAYVAPQRAWTETRPCNPIMHGSTRISSNRTLTYNKPLGILTKHNE